METQRAIYKSSVDKFEKIENTKKDKELIADIKDYFTITQTSINSIVQEITAGNSQTGPRHADRKPGHIKQARACCKIW